MMRVSCRYVPVLLGVILFSHALYAADPPKQAVDVTVGQAHIAIAIPEGFRELSISEAKAAGLFQESNPKIRWLVAFQQAGKSDNPAWAVVATSRAAESVALPFEEFERVKTSAKVNFEQRMSESANIFNSTVQQMIDAGEQELLREIRKVQVSSVPVGIIAEDIDSISFENVHLVDVSVKDGQRDVVMVAQTMTLIFVKGKVLYMYANAYYKGRPTLDWLNRLTAQWVSDTRRAN